MKPVTLSQLWAIMGVTLLSFTCQANGKEYYKWVDSKGITTYSATPQPSQKQEPQLDSAIKNVNAMTSSPSVIKVAETSSSSIKDPKMPTAPNQQAVKSTTANTTSTVAAETLFTLKDCNGVRCWDTQGKHYNFVAGRTYLSATGGKCQKIGNNMHCNK